jgi:protein ImuB
MFASIFIPHFQVQSLVRNEPELSGKAIAVVYSEAGDPALQKVVEANGSAMQAGVEPGMTRLRLQHFPDVTVRQRSVPQENSAHAALLDGAGGYSPRVEDTAHDTVVIDLEGLDRLFGSYAEIAAQIYDQTILLGLQPNVVVAVNPDAAIYASRGFKGTRVIPHGMERKQLASIPLALLTPEQSFLETMVRWGLHTFGDFAALPPVKISERLGQDGVRLHTLARGASTRPLDPHKEPLRFEESMELDDAIAMLEPLRFVLARLLDQICHRLRMRHRATHEVRIHLDAYERVLQLPMPVCDPKMLVELLMLDLESHPPKAAVTKVSVEAIPAKPRAVQNGLFVPLSPEPEKLEVTLARIAHVVGKENVGSPEALDTHRPDAFRIHHFNSMKPVTPIPEPFPSLALRRFRPPLEATVRLRNGAPCWIAFHGFFGPVTTASGPWKSSGEWWRQDHWAREDWDVRVRTQKGLLLFRIYCDPNNGCWFAEGVYD